MRLKKDTDLVVFLGKVKTCSGEVLFETEDGDRLNLKSILSQYLFAALAGNKKLLSRGEVTCENEADFALLEGFLEKTEDIVQ